VIALFTTDAWSAISIDFDDGGGVQTYAAAANEPTDAYSLAVDLLDWLQTNFPGDGWGWTWARDTTTGGATLTYSADSNYDITPNATAQSLMGTAAAYVGVSTFGGLHAGTVAPLGPWSVTLWYASSAGGGVASGSGAVRNACPGTAPIAPKLECVGEHVDAARWTAEAARFATRRRAYVYDLGNDAWRLVSVGAVSTTHREPTLVRLSVEVMG